MKKKLIIIGLMFHCSFIFSQQYINFNKDSINKSDEFGKQGIWYFLDDTSSDVVIYSMITYKNDLKHGYFEGFDIDGLFFQQGFYKYGLLDSIYQEYDRKNGELSLSAYFEYGIPLGILSESGKLLYKIKCEEPKENFEYVFSYYDIERNIKYSNIQKGRKKCAVCPHLDTIRDIPLHSIYYNEELYKITCFINKKYYEMFFVDGRNTMSIIYYSKKPYIIEKIFYYDKNRILYKTEHYNKNGVFKKVDIGTKSGHKE